MARDLATESDEELLIRCRDGDAEFIREAIGLIARRHHRRLINYLYRFVGNHQTAEDLAQEAFIRLLRHARNYKDVARVSTWLYTIAGNLARNELRRRRNRPAISLSVRFESTGREITLQAPDATPLTIAERRELADKVQDAIQRIPEVYREAVVLVDIQGLSYQEAADVLNVRVGTVRSRLSRGRSHLLAILERELEAEPSTGDASEEVGP